MLPGSVNVSWSWPACSREQQDVTRSPRMYGGKQGGEAGIKHGGTDVSVYGFIFLLICFKTQAGNNATPKVLLRQTCQPKYL